MSLPDYDPMKVPGPWLMKCPGCEKTMWAGEDDPDAALSDMANHIRMRHAAGVQRTTLAMLARVRVIEHG